MKHSVSGSRVLLDSNVWVREVGLMSKQASTLRLYMDKYDIRLSLPEVIQAETEQNLIAKKMRDDVQKARHAHASLLRLFGTLPEWRIPSDDAVAERASRLSQGVDLPVEYLELQPDTALRAARRCIHQRPPADHRLDRAYKVGLIWEEILNILGVHDLHLVTNDHGFYVCKESSVCTRSWLLKWPSSHMT